MNQQKIQAKAADLYDRANRSSRGVLEIFLQAFLRFSTVQGPEAAAAIAYYTIFSLFPLLLVLISVAGFLLKGQDAVKLVFDFVDQVLPTTPAGLEQTLQQVIAARDVNGIIGVIFLLISASAMFKTLARNVNRAWADARAQNPLRAQLIAFGLIAALIAVMLAWAIWSALLNFLNAREFLTVEINLPFQQVVLNPLAGLFPWVASFLLFFVIYRWLPYTTVHWSEAFWGALMACVAWGILTFGFGLYLHSGFARYDTLYGPLGSAIALLTWVFMSAAIILFGAHLSASVARAARLAHPPAAEETTSLQ